MKENILKILRNGGVILIATDTVYGLAALPTHTTAVAKIYALKERPADMFLPIMAANINDLELLGLDFNDRARKLFGSHLVPGGITFVLGFGNQSPKPYWLAMRDEVAVRIPNNARLLAIMQETGPLLVTSANRHGRPNLPDVKSILAELNGTPDLVVEDGEGTETPSTIINCRYNPPVIERYGMISAQTIQDILEQ